MSNTSRISTKSRKENNFWWKIWKGYTSHRSGYGKQQEGENRQIIVQTAVKNAIVRELAYKILEGQDGIGEEIRKKVKNGKWMENGVREFVLLRLRELTILQDVENGF